MSKRKWFVGIIAGALLVGLTLAAVPALAAPAAQAQGATPGFAAGLRGFGGSVMDAIAKLLGMTPADIATERQAGKSMVDIAAAKGVDQTTLVDTVVADRQAQLDLMVKSGRITQAQADQALTTMKANVTANLSRTTVGRPANAGQSGLNLGPNGNGMGRGHGRMGQGRGYGPGAGGAGPSGQCPWNQTTPNQTTPNQTTPPTTSGQ